MSAFKRLKIDEERVPIDWRNPRFADWKLSWQGGPSGAKTWDVHRNVMVGGARPAHFFAGATREGGYNSHCTELSVLLPEACKEHVERTLDFIYGAPLGECAAQDVMPLLKIADVLQCHSLQNTLIDLIEKKSMIEHGAIEVLLKDACALELYSIAESLVGILPLDRLKTLNYDLLEINNVCLMRAVARRIAQDMRWRLFLGHGQVRDGSIAIALPNAPSEKSRKGYWCIATGTEEVLAGSHTWKLRIDNCPNGDSPNCNMLFGVVSGDPPIPHTPCDLRQTFHCSFKAGAALDFGGTPWVAITEQAEEGGKWFEQDEDVIITPPDARRVRAGDIVSVSVKLFDGETSGDIEWRLNESLVSKLPGMLAPASYRLSAELGLADVYKPDTLGATLLSYARE